MSMPKRSTLKLPPLKLATSESIGERLARFRKERGMTQVELADKIGITQSFVTSYERNRLRLHPEMLMRFAMALDVATDDILGFNTKGSEPTLSLKIVRRMRRIADLNPSKQKALLQIIDGFLNGVGIQAPQ